MKKIILGMLFLSGNVFAMDSEKLSKKDKECCELLSQVLLQAHINLRFRYDNDFPKQSSQALIHGDIPASFTTAKAYNCTALKDDYYLKDKPKVVDMIVIVPSTKDTQGSITVNLERVDFDELSDQIYNNQMKSRYKHIEHIFNFYNID